MPATGFPLAVDAALREHKVVVVSLVVPGARVDALAAAEAQAGAKLSGSGYIALNVLNEKVAHALLTKLGSLQDPSLLILKRSGEIALGLEGFVDRETVAQAATNASSRDPDRPVRRAGAVRPPCTKGRPFRRSAPRGRPRRLLHRRDRGLPQHRRQRRRSSPGPYTFANAVQATQFVTEAVEALMVLGCDVQAQ